MYLAEKHHCLIVDIGDIKRFLQSSTNNPVGIFIKQEADEGSVKRPITHCKCWKITMENKCFYIGHPATLINDRWTVTAVLHDDF